MKRKIFIFIVLFLIPISVFSQEINKEKMLNSNIAIELWTGEKIYGKVIKVDLSSITIDKRIGFSIFKPNEQTFFLSGIKKVYNEDDKIVYENKFTEEIYIPPRIKQYKNLYFILPCFFTGAIAVNNFFRYSDKMDSADEIEKIDIKESEKLREEADKNLNYGIVFSITTIVIYLVGIQTEEIEIPISNLSLEIKSNKINLSYKF